MKKLALALLLVCVAALPAPAKTELDLHGPTYSNATLTDTLVAQDSFKSLVTDIGMMTSYKPVQPTESLKGTLIPFGFDLGVEGSYTKIDRNKPYWADAVDPLNKALSATQAFTKVHAQIALPFIPVDLGLVYGTSQTLDSLKFTGAEIKYNITKGGVLMPALAIRGAYTKTSGLDVLDVTTYQADISVSKGFLFLTPYAGVGEVWIKGKNKDASVTLSDVSVNRSKAFVGLRIGLFYLFNLVAEGEFAQVNTYSLRLNVHF